MQTDKEKGRNSSKVSDFIRQRNAIRLVWPKEDKDETKYKTEEEDQNVTSSGWMMLLTQTFTNSRTFENKEKILELQRQNLMVLSKMMSKHDEAIKRFEEIELQMRERTK